MFCASLSGPNVNVKTVSEARGFQPGKRVYVSLWSSGSMLFIV